MEGVTTLNQYIISQWVLEYRNTSKSSPLTVRFNNPDLEVI